VYVGQFAVLSDGIACFDIAGDHKGQAYGRWLLHKFFNHEEYVRDC
jgi:hypothetical protein